MLTVPEVKELLSEIKFLNFRFEYHDSGHFDFHENMAGDQTLPIITYYKCNDNYVGWEKMTQISRTDMIMNSSPSYIVQQIFDIVRGILMHEAKELFKYKGKDLYNEHRDEEEKGVIKEMIFGNLEL